MESSWRGENKKLGRGRSDEEDRSERKEQIDYGNKRS